MNYCGIDLALKSSAICVKTQNNKVLKEIEVPTDEDGFRQGLKSYKRLTIVLEVSPLAEWVANILETLGHEAIIIDARKAKALIKTKKKTDKIDAQKLADMARTGWYTAVHRKRGEARLFRTKIKGPARLAASAPVAASPDQRTAQKSWDPGRPRGPWAICCPRQAVGVVARTGAIIVHRRVTDGVANGQKRISPGHSTDKTASAYRCAVPALNEHSRRWGPDSDHLYRDGG